MSEDATNPILQYSKKIIYEIKAVVYMLSSKIENAHWAEKNHNALWH